MLLKIELEINKINEEFGDWERIKKFEITPEIWTIENGLLTPTMKLKRKAIIQKFIHLKEKNLQLNFPFYRYKLFKNNILA